LARNFVSSNSDHIDIAHASLSFIGTIGENFTYFCWFKTTSAGTMTFMDKTDKAGPIRWAMKFTYDLFERSNAQQYNGSINPLTISNPATLHDGVWHSLACSTINTVPPRIYEDGVEPTYSFRQGANNLDYSNSIDFSIGSTEQGTSEFFNGEISFAAVWDIALSNNEELILSHGVCPFVVRNEALRMYCPLDGNDSPEANYASTSTGTVTGTTKFAGNPPVELIENYL